MTCLRNRFQSLFHMVIKLESSLCLFRLLICASNRIRCSGLKLEKKCLLSEDVARSEKTRVPNIIMLIERE